MSVLLEAIKTASAGVNEAGKPVELTSGKVVSISPLLIKLDQKLTLNERMIILTNAVKDHEIDITIHGISDSRGDSISGKTTITIHNGLKVGESVLLLRRQGGQEYLAVGRGNLA